MNPLDAIVGLRLKLMVGAAVVAVVGGLYGSLWLGKAASEKDRSLIVGWAEATCASVGKPYRVDARDKPLARKAWGRDCAAEILRLATNVAGAATASLNTVVAHDTEQVTKGVTYRAVARRSITRIQSGQQQMEQAIVASQDGLIGPDYFDGLNRSLGLRPYIGPSAAAPAGGDHAEGEAGRGAAQVQ